MGSWFVSRSLNIVCWPRVPGFVQSFWLEKDLMKWDSSHSIFYFFINKENTMRAKRSHPSVDESRHLIWTKLRTAHWIRKAFSHNLINIAFATLSTIFILFRLSDRIFVGLLLSLYIYIYIYIFMYVCVGLKSEQ